MNKIDPVTRFWARVRKTDGCWLWTGCIKPNGYGSFCETNSHCTKPRKTWNAHRYSFTLAYGPIPARQQVCHRCDNPACVRPDHLSLGTQSDNLADASRKGRTWRPSQTMTHCWRGHEFTPKNTHLYRGSRHCRACARLRTRTHREKVTHLVVSQTPFPSP